MKSMAQWLMEKLMGKKSSRSKSYRFEASFDGPGGSKVITATRSGVVKGCETPYEAMAAARRRIWRILENTSLKGYALVELRVKFPNSAAYMVTQGIGKDDEYTMPSGLVIDSTANAEKLVRTSKDKKKAKEKPRPEPVIGGEYFVKADIAGSLDKVTMLNETNIGAMLPDKKEDKNPTGPVDCEFDWEPYMGNHNIPYLH